MIRQRRALLHSLATLPTNVWFVGQEGVEKQRAGRYSLASVQGHPGKLLPELARQLIQSYTKPGDWILDPLSGIGTVGVEAVHLSRNYVGIEIEPQFVHWQRENLQAAARTGATREFAVIEGDARRLADRRLLSVRSHRNGPVDAILTSPPYGDRLREQKNPSRKLRELIGQGRFGRNVLPGIYGRQPGNLGNCSNDSYLREMRRVYGGCFEVLKPGGILAVVIQPERTRRELLPLHHQTAAILAEVGFAFLDEVLAIQSRIALGPDGKVEQVAHASFWRRLTTAQLRTTGDPVTLGQVEYVLVFRKPPTIRTRNLTLRPRPVPVAEASDSKNSLPAALAGPVPAEA